MKYKKLEIKDSNWNCIHDLENHLPLQLNVTEEDSSDETTVTLKGVELGDLLETTSLPQKAICHDVMDLNCYTIDTQSIIPFGSEPQITRKFEYLSNIIKVTTDIHVKRPIPAKKFEVDSLNLKGKWKRYAIIDLKDYQQNQNDIKWIDLSNIDSTTLYNSTKHFHILLLENENNSRFEIGVGFDLWRWNYATDTEIKESKDINNPHHEPELLKDAMGNFTIEKINDYIMIKREIITSDKPFDIISHNWRFHWYVAWGEKSSKSQKPKTVELENSTLPLLRSPTGFTEELSGTRTPELLPLPCFHNKKSKNLLHKSIRKIMNKLDNETLELKSFNPNYCTNPSHVSRPNDKEIEHIDITDIMELWLWGSKQLLKRDNKFIITPDENSIFKEFPSFWVMGKSGSPFSEA